MTNSSAKRLPVARTNVAIASFANLERVAARFPRAVWHAPEGEPRGDHLVFERLPGMGQHPKVIDAMIKTAIRMGTGAGGTRNISGTNRATSRAEHELADLHGKASALVFTSGYVSNTAGISTIAKLMSELPHSVGRLQP